MTIAVTGSRGQLGGELCRQLAGEAVGLDLPEFDLIDRDRVRATLAEIRPRAVINTAAYTLVDRAEQEPAICRKINVEGVANLVDACRALDCALVQISTDYVFGTDSGRRAPHGEADETCPQGIYARTKLEAEQVAATWEKHIIVRTCGLYGRLGKNSPGNFVETMLRLGKSGKPLRIVNDQHCTPSYVPHVAQAIRFLVSVDACGIHHVVNTGATTWFGFAQEIFRQANLRVAIEPITTAEYGAPAPRPSYSVLDTSKYHSLPGCFAMPSWQQALAEYLAVRG